MKFDLDIIFFEHTVHPVVSMKTNLLDPDGVEDNMAVSEKLLEILVCPKCKGDLVLTQNGDSLICNACRLKYEIRDDIPIMLIDEAIPLDSDQQTMK